jgi:hypothetical protein
MNTPTPEEAREALDKLVVYANNGWGSACPGEVDTLRRFIDAHSAPVQPEPVAWIPVAERMPASGVTVLACYTNRSGNVRRIRAEWVAAKTIESDGDSEIGEYDEATDCCYDPEGWYEKIDNWGDYSSVVVNEGEVTHWMPLPAHPGASPPPAQPAPDMADAYAGAREDLSIWKRRALEAEKQVRHLTAALAEEVNGPTFMGEPVLPAQAEPVAWRYKGAGWERWIYCTDPPRNPQHEYIVEPLYASPPPAQPAQNPWRDAIDEALVVAHLGVATEPYDDLNRLLEWHHDVWLDPAVSSDAQALIDRGAAEERQRIAQPAQAEPTAEMVRAYLDANDAYWRRVDELPSKIGVWRDGTPQEATLHSLRAAIAAQPKREPLTFVVRSVDAGFRWDSVAQCHIPQLVVEFDPVPTNGPSDAAGWQARDACAAMLSERLTLGEQG